MQVRFSLVKQRFLESYDDYKKNVDGNNKNKRSRNQWEALQMELHGLKTSLQGKSEQFKDIIEKDAGKIDKRRKVYLNKDKQLEYENRINKASSPMKTIQYDKNTKAIIESLYYTTALIMMMSFIYKQYNH
jgi:Skp family chaperone for outer membrane proteins